jgi:nicotinamide riboside kinase
MVPYVENKKLLVINLFSGPGSGKSTIANGLASLLMQKRFRVEYVPETAKDYVWEKRNEMFTEQDYIFSKQNNRLRRLVGKVDIAIVDSPLLLSLVFKKDWFPKSFEPFIIEAFKTYHNKNFFINRKIPFNKEGRNEEKDEAIELDGAIKSLLGWLNHSNGISYQEVNKKPKKAILEIYNSILPELDNFCEHKNE